MGNSQFTSQDLHSTAVEVSDTFHDVINGRLTILQGKLAIRLKIEQFKQYEVNEGKYDGRVLAIFPDNHLLFSCNLIYPGRHLDKKYSISWTLLSNFSSKYAISLSPSSDVRYTKEYKFNESDIKYSLCKRIDTSIECDYSSMSESFVHDNYTAGSISGEDDKNKSLNIVIKNKEHCTHKHKHKHLNNSQFESIEHGHIESLDNDNIESIDNNNIDDQIFMEESEYNTLDNTDVVDTDAVDVDADVVDVDADVVDADAVDADAVDADVDGQFQKLVEIYTLGLPVIPDNMNKLLLKVKKKVENDDDVVDSDSDVVDSDSDVVDAADADSADAVDADADQLKKMVEIYKLGLPVIPDNMNKLLLKVKKKIENGDVSDKVKLVKEGSKNPSDILSVGANKQNIFASVTNIISAQNKHSWSDKKEDESEYNSIPESSNYNTGSDNTDPVNYNDSSSSESVNDAESSDSYSKLKSDSSSSERMDNTESSDSSSYIKSKTDSDYGDSYGDSSDF
uniref:Uncharacterized protein n=1 Tax=Pithovirus LCPAC101 TaxID=2506586 RepID=A0A481Z225_9VIRU|nr:MAG: hypothetical protein LCPAC101_00550 [Pithovirus LCPAC101]